MYPLPFLSCQLLRNLPLLNCASQYAQQVFSNKVSSISLLNDKLITAIPYVVGLVLILQILKFCEF